MTGSPLSANLSDPGSVSTSEPRTGGSVEAGAASGAAETMPEHRKARGHGVPGSCESCGKPWPCPPETAHRRRLRASSAHLADQPIIAGDWLPPDYLLGVADSSAPGPSSHDSIQMAVEHPGADKLAIFLVAGFTLVALLCIVGIGWNAVIR